MICVTLLFMRKELLTGVILVLFASCAQRKVVNTSLRAPNQQFEVRIVAQVHYPYCGGAEPTPEMEKGFTEPMKLTTLYVKKGKVNSENSSAIASFTTNGDGNGFLLLPTGEYCIVTEEQVGSFDEFYKPYKKTSASKSMSYGDENCFKDWYQRPLIKFDVEELNEPIVITQYSRCFVGVNPCANYQGPYPP